MARPQGSIRFAHERRARRMSMSFAEKAALVRRDYRRPPVTEALCEFRFADGSSGWDATFPGRFSELVKARYPGKPRQQNLMQAGIQVADDEQPPTFAIQQGLARVQFPNDDNTRLAAIGVDSL